MMDVTTIAGGAFDAYRTQYEIHNRISSLLYEGSEGLGSIIYSNPSHPHIKIDIEFCNSIPLSNHTAVRKSLELTSNTTSLLCDGHEVYGIGRLDGDYDEGMENAFLVRYMRRFCWQLEHASKTLMYVEHGNPLLRKTDFPSDLLRDHLSRVFGSLPAQHINHLVSVSKALDEQRHGALLIIAEDASSEAERLEQQGYPVTPFPLTEELLRTTSKVDGALIIGTDALCYAIGTILDGMAHRSCTASRGARYNSAIRYVHGKAGRLAIVKSEDGMVDILPKLPPRIKRADLDDRIAKLRQFTTSVEYVDRKDFYHVMNWLDGHRNYLSPDLCSEVNDLWPKAEAKLEKQEWLRGFGRFNADPDYSEERLK
ncbi:diadenylate cyclase [Botrimarina mediterranea]|nr:diadenylate cyclase [Botrimarina mediterranea]